MATEAVSSHAPRHLGEGLVTEGHTQRAQDRRVGHTEITEHRGTWNTHSNPALTMKSEGKAKSLLLSCPTIYVFPILIQGEKEACGCSWDSHAPEGDLLLPQGQP